MNTAVKCAWWLQFSKKCVTTKQSIKLIMRRKFNGSKIFTDIVLIYYFFQIVID